MEGKKIIIALIILAAVIIIAYMTMMNTSSKDNYSSTFKLLNSNGTTEDIHATTLPQTAVTLHGYAPPAETEALPTNRFNMATEILEMSMHPATLHGYHPRGYHLVGNDYKRGRYGCDDRY
jgi:flagellar basal body-associated protein FliL